MDGAMDQLNVALAALDAELTIVNTLRAVGVLALLLLSRRRPRLTLAAILVVVPRLSLLVMESHSASLERTVSLAFASLAILAVFAVLRWRCACSVATMGRLALLGLGMLWLPMEPALVRVADDPRVVRVCTRVHLSLIHI